MALEDIARKYGGRIDYQGIAKKHGVVSPTAPTPPTAAPPGKDFDAFPFMERLKLSFGGRESIEELKQREAAAGLRGKFDVGDIADVAGTSLPFVGGIIGSALGPAGTALGAGIGEAAKVATGKALGLRGEKVPTIKEFGKEAAKVTTTAATTQLAGKLGGYLFSRVKKLASLLTGQGEDVIQAALKNPKLADAAISQGDQTLRAAIRKGSEESLKIRNAFVSGHNLAFRQLAGENAQKVAPKKDLWKAFYSSLDDQVKIGKDGALDFTVSRTKANPGEVSKINNVFQAMREWDDFSLAGLNRLKQLVGTMTKFADEAGIPAKSPTLGKFYGGIDKVIKKNLPESSKKAYSAMNQKFTENIELYDDLVQAFNKGDPFSKMAGLFSKNKDSLRQIVKFYEEKAGFGVSPVVAGRELGQPTQQALFNPRTYLDFFVSPEAQGKFITLAGRKSQRLKGLFPERARKIIAAPIKTGVSKFFSSFFD